MCLLDGVMYWDTGRIECISRTHLAKSNPLRSKGHLYAVHLIEYGVQAIAVHGGLLALSQNHRFKPAYLAAIQEAVFYIDNLDLVTGELKITTSIQMKSDTGVVYTIQIYSPETDLLTKARATVIHID